MDHDQNPAFIRFRLKYFLVTISMVLVGLLLLFASTKVTDPLNSWIKLLLEQVSTALMVGAISGILYEYFLRREFVKITNQQSDHLAESIAKLGIAAQERSEKLRQRIEGCEAFRSLGLTGAIEDVAKFDFGRVIRDSEHLTVLLNDGRTWVGSNYGAFAKRLEDPSKTTRFILLHPHSPLLEVHSGKVGSDPASIRGKVDETIKVLTATVPPKGRVEIYGHHLYNTYSLFLADEVAIVTPYFTSTVRTSPPILMYEDSCPESMFRKLSTDVEALIRASELLASCPGTNRQGDPGSVRDDR